jgi:hypothetical protein
MQREEVVPWSMAAMNGPVVCASVTVCSWMLRGFREVRFPGVL